MKSDTLIRLLSSEIYNPYPGADLELGSRVCWDMEVEDVYGPEEQLRLAADDYSGAGAELRLWRRCMKQAEDILGDLDDHRMVINLAKRLRESDPERTRLLITQNLRWVTQRAVDRIIKQPRPYSLVGLVKAKATHQTAGPSQR